MHSIGPWRQPRQMLRCADFTTLPRIRSMTMPTRQKSSASSGRDHRGPEPASSAQLHQVCGTDCGKATEFETVRLYLGALISAAAFEGEEVQAIRRKARSTAGHFIATISDGEA